MAMMRRASVLVSVLAAAAATLAAAEDQPPVGQDLNAVREGLKAQNALVGADEIKAGAIVEELRAIDARLLAATHAQEDLRESEQALAADYALRESALKRSDQERAVAAAALESRLADIYRRGRLGSSRGLVQAATSTEPLRIARYLAAISQADSTVLQRYDMRRREHEAALEALDAKKNEIDQTRAELVSENANYERARQQKTTLLASVEKNLALHRATRERLTAIEGELQKIMSPEPTSGAQLRALARLAPDDARPFGERKGSLDAPVSGTVRFRFGESTDRGAVVRGLIVQASGDRRVVSVSEGEVVFAGPFPGLGNTIILSHGARYHTVYAQLSSVAHEVGQKVRRNEVLGSLATTNPLLHFELRSEGKAVDPIPWLAGGDKAFSR